VLKSKLIQFLLPTIVALTSFYLMNKFFPEKEEIDNNDDAMRVRGGGDAIKIKLLEKILTNKALKVALILAFTSAGGLHYNKEIIKLLTDKQVISSCFKDGKILNEPICKLVRKYGLNLHTKQINELILNENLTRDDKISLLSIKFESVLHGDYAGKKQMFAVLALGVIIAVCVSGTGGLALILDALYKMFTSGKLSKAVYERLVKTAHNANAA